MRAKAQFILTLSAAVLALPATAQETDPAVAAMEKETALLQAKADLTKARAAAIDAQIAPLKPLAGEGKVTLGQDAGTMEAWRLTQRGITAAAAVIADRFDTKRPVVVLAGDELFNARLLSTLNAEVDGIAEEQQRVLANAPCVSRTAGEAAAPIIPLLGAVGSLLRSDLDVRGVAVAPTDRPLAIAVARQLRLKSIRAVFPSAITNPPEAQTALAARISKLRDENARVADARACLAKAKKPAEVLKPFDNAAARYAAFMQSITTADAAGRVPLAEARALEPLLAANPLVLRVYVEKGGGTLLTRKNILTTFGAAPVRISGGVVASYQATDPATGDVVHSGGVSCTTPLADIRRPLKSVTAPDPAQCDPA